MFLESWESAKHHEKSWQSVKHRKKSWQSAKHCEKSLGFFLNNLANEKQYFPRQLKPDRSALLRQSVQKDIARSDRVFG